LCRLAKQTQKRHDLRNAEDTSGIEDLFYKRESSRQNPVAEHRQRGKSSLTVQGHESRKSVAIPAKMEYGIQ